MGQYGELGKVVELFNGKKNGFFIECGALDGGFCQLYSSSSSEYLNNPQSAIFIIKPRFSGQALSNTLVFELRHQWTGLLVEANPFVYQQLREKQRK